MVPDPVPLPTIQALEEVVTLCQPTGVEEPPCRPTRLVVDVCGSDLEEGCRVRRGVHDYLSEIDAYDDYVRRLRGEEVPEDPSP